MPVPTLLAWSGGKDSALALQTLAADPSVRVTGLLTTVTADVDRVAMHGVRRELLDAQADAVGLPVRVVALDRAPDDGAYRAAMGAALGEARADGVEAVAFGDLHLADVRAYREDQVAEAGLTPWFPLWGADTARLARAAVDDGLRATVVCVDTTQLDVRFGGRLLDHPFLDDLPAEVDPCGERGEFHTFVHAGGPLRHPVPVQVAGGHHDGRFAFTDLRPA